MTQETKRFETEVSQILELMINSVYSQREIFLRELISNASDALNKLNYEAIEHPELAPEEEKHIRIVADEKSQTLSVMDNGIGMTYDEVVKNIGTIAYSGSRSFVQKMTEIKNKPELIGQFGVGFYSAFMVGKKVSLHTQKAGTKDGIFWESTGDGTYTIDHRPRTEGAGTTITISLKDKTSKDTDDETFQDFTDEWTIKSIVKKYSDFIEYPIKMKMTKEEPVLDKDGKALEGKTETKTVDEVLNSMKALWLKSPSDIKEDEYNDFYKHTAKDWTDPLDTIHYKAEGTQEFSALMYIPSQVPYNYNQRETKYGFSLYVKRVFIMECCEELLPQYLRFMKGVVDSSDLPLNVSREILQKDRRLSGIRRAVVSKLLRHFKALLENDREKYEKFWKNFGSTLKEGLPTEHSHKNELTELLLFHSSISGKPTSLKEYVNRMPAEQKSIYYITGESITQLQNSPYLEQLQKKNFDVLFMVDPVDEWVMNSLTEYSDKKIESITKENLDLANEEEKKKIEEELKTQETKFKPLMESLKSSLEENVKDVKLSDRLVDSPVCLVSGADDPSAHMERLLESMGQKMPKSKRILEINPHHPIFDKMLELSSERKKNWAHILYNQALLNEGGQLENPMQFSKQIAELMLEAR